MVTEALRATCTCQVAGSACHLEPLAKWQVAARGTQVHEGKVKSVSCESVSETTDRVSRDFRESKKSEMHIVGSIPCV